MESSAIQTLSKNGKSFRFAGMLLSREQLVQAARLYQFCRWIDDIADETDDKQAAKTQLRSIRSQLVSGSSDFPVLSGFLSLQSELGISHLPPCHLIDGVLSDTENVAINTVEELLQYAYRVAGVVGLMMNPILKANPEGNPHAVDLGIAMQLTNIARDVMEDAKNSRRYLPAQWCDITAEEIVTDSSRQTRMLIQDAILKLLALAETYYQSARQGFRFLPPRSRRAIAVASAVYREIGIQLKGRGTQYWLGRTVVSKPRKVAVAFYTLAKPAPELLQPHQDILHKALQGLHVVGLK